MNKLFLDDLRNPPDGTWTVCRTVDDAVGEVINLEEIGKMNGLEGRDLYFDEMSLDHDLGICPKCMTGVNIIVTSCKKGCKCNCHETGYDFVKWLAETNMWSIQKPKVHSANPVGAGAMRQMIDRYWHPVDRN